MKLWATRDSKGVLLEAVVELWNDKPINANVGGVMYMWTHHHYKTPSTVYMKEADFLRRFKRLPRRDRPMCVTLTGRVAK